MKLCGEMNIVELMKLAGIYEAPTRENPYGRLPPEPQPDDVQDIIDVLEGVTTVYEVWLSPTDYMTFDTIRIKVEKYDDEFGEDSIGK